MIAVFREEKKGEDGLKIIETQTKTPYTLAVDLNNEKTGRYSTERGEFNGYVINSEGVITKIFEGDLRNRAKSNELLEAIKAASGSEADETGSETKEPAGSDTKGSGTTGSGTTGSSAKGSATKESSGGSDSKN